MKLEKRHLHILLKAVIFIFLITIPVLSVSSFLWQKIGMSPYPSSLGYTLINSSEKIDNFSVEEGDLIVVKEYLLKNTPQKYDLVIYNLDGKLNIGAIDEVIEDSGKTNAIRVTPNLSENSIDLYDNDIVGEFSFKISNAGLFITNLISPVYIISIYIWMIFIYLIYKAFTVKSIRESIEVTLHKVNSQEVKDKAKNILKSTYIKAKNLISKVLNKENLNKVQDTFKNVIEKSKDKFNRFYKKAKPIFTEVYIKVKDILKRLYGKTKGIIVDNFKCIYKKISDMAKKLSDKNRNVKEIEVEETDISVSEDIKKTEKGVITNETDKVIKENSSAKDEHFTSDEYTEEVENSNEENPNNKKEKAIGKTVSSNKNKSKTKKSAKKKHGKSRKHGKNKKSKKKKK